MKSSQTQLRQRGLLDLNIANEYMDLEKEDLLLKPKEKSQYRSAAIHVLTLKYHSDDDYTSILLNQLIKEKALYTKIEIQNSLAKHGNINQMCQYLGTIGNNQYQEIPLKGSLKKSYPLPRDMIARSLAHIHKDRFQEFYACLPHLNIQQFQEAIDALGFLCFYHPDIIHDDIYRYIKSCFLEYQNNELIVWKLVTCLSAFKMSKDFLINFKTKHPTIQKEVERSLRIIDQSYNH